ncbi:MAG: hypothetical protein K0R75_3413, partial [Paenibacillaceae bacterium]|nr:hypothetical protein [Paenibacillaceae bacterium]
MGTSIDKPNVLYIFADQLSMQALDIYTGNKGPNTPNINFLAENGVRFTRSYCSTPQCSPSRSSLLTGLYPHRTGVPTNVGSLNVGTMSTHFTTIGSYLRDHGYHTAYFGKWHLGDTPIEEYGFDQAVQGNGGDARKTDEMLAFLDEQSRAAAKPWFAMLSYLQPHDICKTKPKIKSLPGLDLTRVQPPANFHDDLSTKPAAQRAYREKELAGRLKEFPTEDDWKYYVAYYYSLIEGLDNELARVLHKLRETGQADNTLIVFSAHHGDMMGVHRMPFKGPAMYDVVTKIPLIFSWPGRLPTNESRDQLTVNTDHFPTICELLGLEVPPGLHGVSFKECLYDSEAKSKDFAVLEYYSKGQSPDPIRTIVQDEMKYCFYATAEEELYDLRQDPLEIHNLAKDPSFASQKAQLQRSL